jgi:hypothetical protein
MADVIGSIDLTQIQQNVPSAARSLSIADVVTTIFSIVVPIAGALLLLLLLYGGITYMTAAGNDEQVAKAKKIMTQAIIGIIIVAFSFGIGIWIINTLGISKTIDTPNSTTTTATTQVAVAAKPGSKVTLSPKNGPASGPASGTYNLQSGISLVPTQIAALPLPAPQPTSKTSTNKTTVTEDSVPASNSGITTDAVPASNDPATANLPQPAPQPVTVSAGETKSIIPGYTYDISFETDKGVVCTATSLINEDTIVSATIDPTGQCKVQFLNSFIPKSGTVTINALDSETFQPVANVDINVAGQQAATSTTKGDIGTQYLKGRTSSSGVTTFNIDQAGQRTISASNSAYITCSKDLLLSAGNALVLYLTKTTANNGQPYVTTTNECQSTTLLFNTDPATANLPQPAPQTTPIESNLPEANTGSKKLILK